jgi:conjugative relaxase-like TrwC/TraI family protein
MLSIAKLRVGQEAYQLSGVAQSLDDYYTGTGEAHGQWVGGSAARLGLTGQVDADDLRAVLAGLAPGNGGLTPNGDRLSAHPRRVPGFDLTFKAPKSASVLYAVSDDPRVQGAVIEAGETAMRSAIGWLEREAIRVRRGSHNQAWLAAHGGEPGVRQPTQLESSGVVAASFRHRTSRASDPLLHWHVLVANLVEGGDGKWSAFTHPELYRHVRAAGEVFQTVYRAELSASLGVEWRPGRHVPEIAGIPQGLIDAFSKRTNEIDAWLAATGTPDTPEGRQLAVLATRRHKPEMEHARFDAAWKTEADQYGWGPAHADGLIAAGMDRSQVDFDGVWRLAAAGFNETGSVEHFERVVDPEEWIATVLRQDLTSDRSTFSYPDLMKAIAARQGDGTSIETLERIAQRFLASEQVIAVANTNGIAGWTSRELLDIETRFINHTTSGSIVPALPQASIDHAHKARPGLGDDQAEALVAICASVSPLSVLIGPAGTGKTYTVDAIRGACEHAGHTVLGAAPSARAALELAAGANLTSTTLHSLLDSWQRGYTAPVRNSLLVIDEAGMADIRTLEAVASRQIAAGGRVLLVGDHHQLPEVGAGGGLAYATHNTPTVAELTINRRQHHQWEQEALRELRNGNVADAVAAYLNHQRVITTDTPTAMIDTAVTMWFDAHHRGQTPVLLAGTNDLVNRLNAAIVNELIARGELGADTYTYGDGHYRVGERIVVRRNSADEHTVTGAEIAVANGQPGTIIAAADHQLTVRLDTGDDLILSDRYLRRGGHVTHAYALTTHRAQGGTWDLSIAVGADGLYREGAYVELSRGAAENWIVLTDPEAAELAEQSTSELARHDTGITPPDEQPDNLDQELTNRLQRSRAKQFAHTIDPELDLVDQLSRTRTHNELTAHLRVAYTAERIATDTVGTNGDQLADRLGRIEHVATHIAIGQHVSPHDRHNVGTVINLDDTAGTVTVHFESNAGRQATKAFAWEQLRFVEPRNPDPRELSPAGRTTLDTIATKFGAMIEQWNDAVRANGAEPGETRRYQHALDRHTQRSAATIVAEQPDWLHHSLGQRPADVAGARTWDDTLNAIVEWRNEHNLDRDVDGLGRRPHDEADGDRWDQLNLTTAQARIWLATTDRTPPDWPIHPSHHELTTRLYELEQIFADAPTDCRHIIQQLESGQLSFDDTTELLTAAQNQQDARRTWIVEHWPHVVEHQEINRTLTLGEWGPDPTILDTATDRTTLNDNLRNAITQQAPWIRAALCAIATPQDTTISDDAIELLQTIADYRTDHNITGSDPLGPPTPATDTEYQQIAQMLDDVATGRSHEQLEVTSGQEEFVAFELDN